MLSLLLFVSRENRAKKVDFGWNYIFFKFHEREGKLFFIL